MSKTNLNGIPISVSLSSTLEAENIQTKSTDNKKRLIVISSLAVLIAVSISFIAKLLVYLINLITNISFHGNFSIAEASPVGNSLGIWIILMPILGGVIVGIMALYG